MMGRSAFFGLLFISTILFVSCDKTENLLLSDSEILMKELKGVYTLESVRHEEYASVDGGNTWGLSLDTTYSATGSLDLSSISKADFEGSLSISYRGSSETHLIHGNASATGGNEKLWIYTTSEEDIQSMFLYSSATSIVEGWLDERDDSHLLLRISEISFDYSGRKSRYFRFVKQ